MNKTEHRGLKWRVPPDMTRFRQVLNSPAPIFPIALTLIYYDQRIRKEGYDIERMMEAAGLNAIAAPAFARDSMPQALESTKTEVRPG